MITKYEKWLYSLSQKEMESIANGNERNDRTEDGIESEDFII